MFTVKLMDENPDQQIQQVWECQRYNKTLTGDKHYLTLYGVTGQNNNPIIDLKELPEDKGGKYSRDLYIMNSNGQTIDKWSW